VNGVTVRVGAGEMSGWAGGAGKTTTFNMIVGIGGLIAASSVPGLLDRPLAMHQRARPGIGHHAEPSVFRNSPWNKSAGDLDIAA
jgi:ABC-type lipopolysaccharide export system ATPase subunit